MANLTLVWLAVAEAETAPVEVAEEFTLWTVADEAALEGLLFAIGREQWEELQEYLESHPECRYRWSDDPASLAR
jgi:hypothetical protein